MYMQYIVYLLRDCIHYLCMSMYVCIYAVCSTPFVTVHEHLQRSVMRTEGSRSVLPLCFTEGAGTESETPRMWSHWVFAMSGVTVRGCGDCTPALFIGVLCIPECLQWKTRLEQQQQQPPPHHRRHAHSTQTHLIWLPHFHLSDMAYWCSVYALWPNTACPSVTAAHLAHNTLVFDYTLQWLMNLLSKLAQLLNHPCPGPGVSRGGGRLGIPPLS